MLVQIGRCLAADTEAQSVDEVRGDHRVDWTDIQLARMIQVARLYKVLNQRLDTENDIFEALELLYPMDEGVHAGFALRQFHRSILVPESLVPHVGVGFAPAGGLPLEQLFGQRVESIVAQACRSGDQNLGKEAGHLHLDNHVVHGKHPLAIRQLGIFLRYAQVFDEIDVTPFRDGQLAAFHMQRGIRQDI